MKIYVHLGPALDVASYARRFEQGLEPDRSPYGFHLAATSGNDVRFSCGDNTGRTPIAGRIVRKITELELCHSWRNRRSIAWADVIWTMTESEAFSVALLMRLKLLPKRPIIGNAVWLLNRWHLMHPMRKALYRAAAKSLSVLTVHSNLCIPVAHQAFPNLDVLVSPFGINKDVFATAPYTAGANTTLRIVALGNDRTRDWTTLVQAFGGDHRVHVTVFCSWFPAELIRGLDNVTVRRTPTLADFLTAYRTADVVAVPMKPNIFSGITVALEAAAIGRPILASRTGALLTYFEEKDIIFCNPEDPDDMRNRLISLSQDQLREFAQSANFAFHNGNYSTKSMITRYIQISKDLLERRII